jgi:hypothetical protein
MWHAGLFVFLILAVNIAAHLADELLLALGTAHLHLWLIDRCHAGGPARVKRPVARLAHQSVLTEAALHSHTSENPKSEIRNCFRISDFEFGFAVYFAGVITAREPASVI